MGESGKPYILDANLIVKSGRHAKDHARSLGGLYKEHMHMIPPYLLQAKRHAARSPAYAAGNIDKERMLFIHLDAQFFYLSDQALCGYCISHE